MFRHVISTADYYMDLHGGDLIEALVPFTIIFKSGNEQVNRTSRELGEVFGIEYLVRGETPGSAYGAAATAGIPSLLAESGGQGIWPRPDVDRLSEGVNRVMRHLEMIPGPAPEPRRSTLLDRFLWLRSEHDGFWYPAVSVGDAVKEGQDLGVVRITRGACCRRRSLRPTGACCSS